MSQSYSNPFQNIEIPDNTLPTSPSTGFVQTQNSNQDVKAVMTQQSFTGSEDTSQVMNQFTNMVTNQNTPPQAPVFQPQAQNPFQQQPQPPVFQPQQQIQQPQVQQQPQFQTIQAPPLQQQPVAFQNPQQPQFQNNNGNFRQPTGINNSQQQKYMWTELYWFLNPKIKTNSLGNETPLLIVAFNADYGNLNIRFCNIKNLSENYLATQDIERTPAHINLYAEHAVDLLQSPVNAKINIVERVFKLDNTWKPGISVIMKENNAFILTTVLNNIQYVYTLVNDQYWAFCKALEFMINGTGWALTLLDRLVLNR